ncbi:hypothetical protein Patl1_13997 [Pistacia atlantica]|uniref:Uncharacterized protein n=1 Tax=Pistacia atlantica TaxID=434234 RepID=A0ACC1AXH7_9ROSI|nr:hypothetical protein Patl1_13997 [Pistacia atlantica]
MDSLNSLYSWQSAYIVQRFSLLKFVFLPKLQFLYFCMISMFLDLGAHSSLINLHASWTESKPKLEKDPQGRATNSDLDPSDTEKLFQEHVKMLYEVILQLFHLKFITTEAVAQETEVGKTVLNSWSTAKRLLKPDPRYNKMPRKEREALWRRYAAQAKDAKSRSSGRSTSGSTRNHEQR